MTHLWQIFFLALAILASLFPAGAAAGSPPVQKDVTPAWYFPGLAGAEPLCPHL